MGTVGSGTAERWPERLWLVRHGESAGNVARVAAETSGAELIAIDERDQDVPLSPLGVEQARALGRWIRAQPAGVQPTVVLASPFRRAVDTAQHLVDAAGLPLSGPVLDERLREKEFGLLDRYTRAGILARFPQEAALRARLGKFYYRPPGGESWADVILRLRSFLDSVQLQYRNERVLLVVHQVIVLCMRYILEQLGEPQILAIDREKDVANGSLTSYRLALDAVGRPSLALEAYNFVVPLEDHGAPVTHETDRTPE